MNPHSEIPASARASSPGRWLVRLLAALVTVLLPSCTELSDGKSAAPTPAFSLAVSPAGLSIPAGGKGYATVTVSRGPTFTEAIVLSLEGAPVGVVASGTVAAGAQTGQLAFQIASDVTPQSLDALQVKGTSGSLTGTAAFKLVVAAALPVGHISPDLVQSCGGTQAAGGIENSAVAFESVTAIVSKDAAGTGAIRHGFHPSGQSN